MNRAVVTEQNGQRVVIDESTGEEIGTISDDQVVKGAPVVKGGMELSTANGDVSSLVRLAIERGVDVEVLERLVALQERVTERNAETAMAQALAAFQHECPPIPRTAVAEVRKNGVKQYEYRFAPLEKIVAVIRPHLRKHGLSYTHDAEVADGSVTVICTLQHIEGARRTSKFTGPFDNSGGKNALQAVGSARSYGRRYTLVDVLGLTEEDDTDGADPEDTEPITKSQAADLASLCDEVKADRAKFLRFMDAESFEAIPASAHARAIRALEDKRKKAQP